VWLRGWPPERITVFNDPVTYGDFEETVE
jgi:hypothetical protein